MCYIRDKNNINLNHTYRANILQPCPSNTAGLAFDLDIVALLPYYLNPLATSHAHVC